jgi:hypothetical protein
MVINPLEILSLAREFRQAIFAVDRSDFPALADFPHGSCGDASILLGQYLYDRLGSEWTYVAAARAMDGLTHAWIEREGTIADITADQFYDVKIPVVVTTDRAWYEQFSVAKISRPALVSVLDEETASSLRAALELIMAGLRQ